MKKQNDDELFLDIFKNQLRSVKISYSNGMNIDELVEELNSKPGAVYKDPKNGISLYDMMVLHGVPENASLLVIGKYLMSFYSMSNESNPTALKMLKSLTESNTSEGNKLKAILEGKENDKGEVEVDMNDILNVSRRK